MGDPRFTEAPKKFEEVHEYKLQGCARDSGVPLELLQNAFRQHRLEAIAEVFGSNYHRAKEAYGDWSGVQYLRQIKGAIHFIEESYKGHFMVVVPGQTPFLITSLSELEVKHAQMLAKESKTS